MLLHCDKLGLKVANRIICTGGASQNKHILQVISDVFGVPVFIGVSILEAVPASLPYMVKFAGSSEQRKSWRSVPRITRLEM